MPGCGRPDSFRAAVGPICAGLAVLAACSPGTKPGGTATLQTAPPSTAATTTTDPWAVPATITPAYLDRVLAELDHIDGDAKRDARKANSITPLFTQLEEAIRAGPADLVLVTRDWEANITDGFANIRTVPGDRKTEVLQILQAPPPCVLAAVSVDFSAVTAGPSRAYPPWFVALIPTSPSVLNPTGWQFADDGFEPGGVGPDPKRACAA